MSTAGARPSGPRGLDSLPELPPPPSFAGRAAILILDAATGEAVEPGAVCGPVRAVRLKGCGNYVDGSYGGASLAFPFPGMPLKPMQKIDLMTMEQDAEAVEVRGVAFPHTARRELLMARDVSAALAPLRQPCALSPLACATYAAAFHPDEPAPAVRKCVSVTDTLGERRVVSHLLPGLAALVPLLLPAAAGDPAGADGALASLLLPAPRRSDHVQKQWNDDGTFEETTRPVVPTFAAVARGAAFSELADAAASAEMGEAEESEAGASAASLDAARLALDGWRREAFGRARDEWAASRAAAAGDAAPGGGSVLAHLFWRVGREAGVIRGGMTAAGISWGNFLDHELEPHNNSHPNNLVVMPPSAGTGAAGIAAAGGAGGAGGAEAGGAAAAGSPAAAGGGWGAMLAPLDLDMAFNRAEFFENTSGRPSPGEADSTLAREAVELRSNLAGVTASTGLAGIDDGTSAAASCQAIVWALRDTMVRGYDVGLAIGTAGTADGASDPHPTTAALDRACHALAAMALVLAADNVS